MASRSAKRPRARQVEEFDDEGFGAFVARHRLLVGGLTAFAVSFSYVAANAIWYQPHAHASAFFATRPLAEDAKIAAAPTADPSELETIIRLERQDSETPEMKPAIPQTKPTAPAVETVGADTPALPPLPAATPSNADAVVGDVQRILAGLNLYDGKVDGLTGPQTRTAIEAYQKMVGLTVSGEIDEQLLTQLGASSRATPPIPSPPPEIAGTDQIATSSAAVVEGDPLVMRIQAGLKAFGNDGIEIDGVIGSRTTAAIREFQSLFGLPETGEPDEALYAKMREIGLTN